MCDDCDKSSHGDASDKSYFQQERVSLSVTLETPMTQLTSLLTYIQHHRRDLDSACHRRIVEATETGMVHNWVPGNELTKF